MNTVMFVTSDLYMAFLVLQRSFLLVGRQEGHPASKQSCYTVPISWSNYENVAQLNNEKPSYCWESPSYCILL